MIHFLAEASNPVSLQPKKARFFLLPESQDPSLSLLRPRMLDALLPRLHKFGAFAGTV